MHGDFRLDNLIVDHDLQVLAVIDWEMATLGDPLADLGLFLVYWDLAGQADNALSTAMGPAAGFHPAGNWPAGTPSRPAPTSAISSGTSPSGRSSSPSSSRACGSGRADTRYRATGRWPG